MTSRSTVPVHAYLAACSGAVVVLVGGGLLASRMLDFPVEILWQDPAGSKHGAFYLGGMSYLGVLGWCVAATTCLLAAWTLRRRDRGGSGLLAGLGALSAVLCLDDLFMFHERVAPVHLRIDERLVMVGYAVALGAIAWRHRDRFFDLIDPLLFGAAVAAFAGMAAVDLSLPDSPAHVLVEEGLKLLGVLLWAGCLVRAAGARLRATQRVAARRADEPVAAD